MFSFHIGRESQNKFAKQFKLETETRKLNLQNHYHLKSNNNHISFLTE